MGFGIALVLAASVSAGMSGQIVAVPIAADPLLQRVRIVRPVAVFAAPVPLVDLRRLRAADWLAAADVRPLRARFTVSVGKTLPELYRTDSLIASDGEAQFTGRKLRKSGMAAGLSVRSTIGADGSVLSEVGMAGPVGRALTRIALDATRPD